MPVPQEIARPDWIAGRDIVLSDARAWTFPLPRIEFRLTPSGPLERKHHAGTETNLRYGRRFFDLQEKLGEYIDRVSEVPDDEPGGFDLVEYYRLLKPVAADLLIRNYDLAPEEIDDLLTYVPGCEVNKLMWRSVNEVARGSGGDRKRWLRLANLITASPRVLYLEDAIDLAEWRTRPPLMVIEGRMVGVSQVPTLAEWTAPTPDEGGASSGMLVGGIDQFFGP